MGRTRPEPASEQPPARDRRDRIDGPSLRQALAGGAAALSQQADALNAINVFPIPDGDTGTNMSQTMRAALEEAEREPGETAGAVAKAAARGALMGAKGNSGVILSQILVGLAAMPAGAALDAPALADGLERGRAAAYHVVSNPKEGTILTAITAAASAAAACAASGGDADATFDAAVDATRDAVARTPELLPVLKEAGVVDAGAQGLYVLLDGMLRALRGAAPSAGSGDLGAIDPSWLAATRRAHNEGARAGFCTEFVVQGRALDGDAIRARLSPLGNSLLVVGGGDLVRVHVHTHAPGDALAAASTLGTISHEKVEDMEAQFQALTARADAATAARQVVEGIAVVAIGAGAGIEALLRSIGASAIVHGGQTMNPSAGDIRAAIEATGAAEVIVLPDNKNVIMAAQQAADGLSQHVRVIPTRSIPQGVAALVALNTEATLDENVAAMQDAIAQVHTGEVTLAARATRIHGLQIRKGQPIGIVDGDLVVAEESIADAVRGCVARMADGRDTTLITLYAGAGQDEAAAAALADALRAEFGAEVEVVDGSQPHYPYLIGVE
jgi:hypothetical protein